ncbi:MAG: MFS transporter [Candidatus Andeanibacterium colombiense]|uniref:MFS transporter n=1 Tax=Candidatus Andeanibacterium colombiense TaxID=3121345 RepID=A0AAJ5X5R7_9SPHN|nr:MAG: MFS transporter [Sphingomonadaceae bacterium]
MADAAPAMAPNEAGNTARPGARAMLSLVILSGIVGLNTVDRNMFGLLLPQIQRDVPISDTALGFLMGPAFVIVYSLAGVPIAWLADRTGRRTIIAAGLAFWSVVTMLTGAAQTLIHLLMARMALGVGEASNMAPTSALIGDMFRGRWRVLAMAVFSAGGPLAIMLFYPLIGWIAEHHGWRPTYPLMGAIGLVVAALTLLVVREPRRAVPGKVGQTEDGFVKSAVSILKSKSFLLLCAGGVMISINYSAVLAWLPAFMLRVHGLDAQATGALLGTYKGLLGVAATLAGGVAVTLLMQLDRRWMAWAPMLFAFGMIPAQMLLLLADNPLWWHVGLALETIGMQGITPALFALLITLLEPRVRATGAALYLLIFNLVGQSVGPLAVGMLNDGPFAALGAQAIRYSLLTAPAVIALGAILLFVLSLSMEGGKEEAHR